MMTFPSWLTQKERLSQPACTKCADAPILFQTFSKLA
jgi:hypothetical protein